MPVIIFDMGQASDTSIYVPVQTDEVGVIDPCVFAGGLAEHDIGTKKKLPQGSLFKPIY